jgi:hypothetical protein
MTAEEELRSLLHWAEQMQLENVAAALRRVLSKMNCPPVLPPIGKRSRRTDRRAAIDKLIRHYLENGLSQKR